MISLNTRLFEIAKIAAVQISPIVILISIFTFELRKEFDPTAALVLLLSILILVVILEKIIYYKVKSVELNDITLRIIQRDNTIISCNWQDLKSVQFSYRHWLWCLNFNNETVFIPKSFTKEQKVTINENVIRNAVKYNARVIFNG